MSSVISSPPTTHMKSTPSLPVPGLGAAAGAARVQVVTHDGQLIVRSSDYSDMATFRRQMAVTS
ncbi:MAG: hypothetical protein JWN52_3686 [Actinomycetia bacterium]|nr:hypothetical protein [Actinomycetes bacterium]